MWRVMCRVMWRVAWAARAVGREVSRAQGCDPAASRSLPLPKAPLRALLHPMASPHLPMTLDIQLSFTPSHGSAAKISPI